MSAIKNSVVLACCALVTMLIFVPQTSMAGGENSESKEWVVLVSKQRGALGADVIVNGSRVGKLLSPSSSEYSRFGPHIRLRVGAGVYVFRIEHPHYVPFEKQYTIQKRLPEPGITSGDNIIIVKLSEK